MSRFFVKMMLGLLTSLAVVLPFVLNKRNYEPTLQRARDVVKQTQDRAQALEGADAAAAPGAGAGAPDGHAPSEAAKEVQQITKDATARGRMGLDEAHRLRDAMDKLNKERRDLADQ